MSISRRIKNSIKNLGIKKYSLYALGEVLLIVAGVLIAININNYNDKSKNEKQLNLILSNISNDLNTDVIRLDESIDVYEGLDSVIAHILENKYSQNYFDTINQSNYLDCPPCFANHTGFNSFSPKVDGYNQLKDFDLGTVNVDENLSQSILLFYKDHLSEISLIEQTLLSKTFDNLESLEEFDWYVDYLMGKYRADAIDYFQHDQLYKSKLITFRVLAMENQLYSLKRYRNAAIDLKEKMKVVE